MPTAVYTGSGGSFPPIVAPAPQTGAPGDHVLTLTDATTGRPIRGTVRIDGSLIRATDAGGRIQIPLTMLRLGARELRFEAPAHDPQEMRVTVAGRLEMRIAMARTGAAPASAPGGGELGPISLAWGPVLGAGDDPLNIALITPASGPASLTSDQPTAETDISITDVFAGAISAMLSGVAAGTAVTWLTAPADLAGDNQVAWIAAGPCCVAHFRDTGTHAQGSYSVTATVDGETYGPITLTVLES